MDCHSLLQRNFPTQESNLSFLHGRQILCRLSYREVFRPFRYDLNQIPYDSTVEVRNRFKRLDLIDRVPEELWMEFMTWYRSSDQDHPQEKETQKGEMAV